jgi:hypothetical protein
MNTMKPTCIAGLTTDIKKITTAGQYTINTKTTEVPPSGIVVTISQSGSTSSSVVTPTTSSKQRKIDSNATFNCQVGDILTVAVTSSAPGDQPPNLIQTIIVLRQGL